MNNFDKWLSESFSYTSPEARESMRLGFIGGLRRAAEIAQERQRHGTRIHDSDIEAEATRLESEGE